MDSQSDLEEIEEEEILIYADFAEAADDSLFNVENLQVLNILGIDEEHPIIQVNNSFYEGTYQRSLGTHLFFGEAEPEKSEDPVFEPMPEVPLEFVCKTRKILQLNRAFLEKISDNESETNSTPIADIKVETFSNEKEAIEALVKELPFKLDDKQAERERLRRIQVERKAVNESNVASRSCKDSDPSKTMRDDGIGSIVDDSMDADESSDATYIFENILDRKGKC